MKQLKKDLYMIRYGLILLVLYCVVMQITFKTVCPLKGIFHITCPGCGLTHAFFYFFTGRVKEAFLANPSFVFWLVTISFFLYDRYIKEMKIKPFPAFFIVSCMLTFVIYVLRSLLF